MSSTWAALFHVQLPVQFVEIQLFAAVFVMLQDGIPETLLFNSLPDPFAPIPSVKSKNCLEISYGVKVG